MRTGGCDRDGGNLAKCQKQSASIADIKWALAMAR